MYRKPISLSRSAPEGSPVPCIFPAPFEVHFGNEQNRLRSRLTLLFHPIAGMLVGRVNLRLPVLWQNAVVFQRLIARKEWKFFGVLPKASPGLATAWWALLLLRGILPAAFAI